MVRHQQEKVARVSISLQPRLREEFDRVSGLMGYDERSKALQIAIRNMIGDFEIRTNPESIVTGTVLMLYNHEVGGVDSAITEIGHDHRFVIVSSLHLHLDNDNCMNVIIVRGKARKIMEFESDLRKLVGVKQIKESFLTIDS